MGVSDPTTGFGLKSVVNTEVVIGTHHLFAGNCSWEQHHGYQKQEEPGPMLGHASIVTGRVVMGFAGR